MAPFVWTNCSLLVGDLDLTAGSGGFTAVAMDLDVEMQDATVFVSTGANTRRSKPGLRAARVEAGGYFDGADDAKFFAAYGGASMVVTVIPVARAVGAIAYFMNAAKAQYRPLGQGQLGAMLPWEFSALNTGSRDAVRGVVDLSLSSQTGAANGTGANLGALATEDERVFAAVHVPSCGGNVDIVLESDDNAGFTTAATRATMTTIASPGGAQFMEVTGSTPITDTYWRLRVTGATTADIVGSIGRLAS